jgi:ribosomal protein S27AE
MTLEERALARGAELASLGRMDDLFDLAAEMTRAHAMRLGVPGVKVTSIELLACPSCGGRVVAELDDERAACTGCGWRGTVAEACR